jgi:hypothetical protein
MKLRDGNRRWCIKLVLLSSAGCLALSVGILFYVLLLGKLCDIQDAARAFHSDVMTGRIDDAYERTTERFRLGCTRAHFRDRLMNCPAFSQEFVC